MFSSVRTLRRALTVGAVVAAVVWLAAPVQAIKNGQVDKANRYPNVGAIVVVRPSALPGLEDIPLPWVAASGVLIHPRLMLTAGHVVEQLEAALAAGNTFDDGRVSFSPGAHDPASWI